MELEHLAHIGQIIKIDPIDGADFIELAVVSCDQEGEWNGIIRKGDFQINDLCEVYLQDALLPTIDRFAFMSQRKWHIKMARFKGVPSECLIMPLTEDTSGLGIGSNIADIVGVTKYSNDVMLQRAKLGGDIEELFPSFIPKTDEPNFQRSAHLIEALVGQLFYATIKADGSSGTVFWKDGNLHCCSRNYDMKRSENVAVWKIADKYELERKLENTRFALQFEMVGPGIQKNPLGLNQLEMRLFQIYDWGEQKYLDWRIFQRIAHSFELPTVDTVIFEEVFNQYSKEDLYKMAEVKYPNGKNAEGIVIRPITEQIVRNQRLSFKVINLLYKD